MIALSCNFIEGFEKYNIIHAQAVSTSKAGFYTVQCNTIVHLMLLPRG